MARDNRVAPKTQVQHFIWNGGGTTKKCAACGKPILRRDPVYSGIAQGRMIHEWCAWAAKEGQRMEAEGQRSADG